MIRALKLVRSLMTAFLCAVCIPYIASAQDCANPSPKSSPAFVAFEDYVQREYLDKGPTSGYYRNYAFGHVLGRLALAVRDNPERRAAFDCIRVSLQQDHALRQLLGEEVQPYSQVTEASMGMHDGLVRERFGVTEIAPLDVIFETAFSSANPNRPFDFGTSPGPVPPLPQPPVRPDISGFGTQDMQSSRAPSRSGTHQACTSADRWSLSKADSLMLEARSLASSFPGDCTGANWLICQSIAQKLYAARDEIFQVFDLNHDGVADCRLCSYDAAIERAKRLTTWEKWMGDRYYNMSGLGTIYYTISDHVTDQICRAPVEPDWGEAWPPSPDFGTASPVTPSPAAPAKHACGDPNVKSAATWLFYRTGFGGGNAGYAEKGGVICYGTNYYYTYKGASMDGYRCTGDWENCKADSSSVTPYTKPVWTNSSGNDVYEYAGGSGVRKSN